MSDVVFCACGNAPDSERFQTGPSCSVHHRDMRHHPSGYQIAKAKNQKILTLINAISDTVGQGDHPVVSLLEMHNQIMSVRNLISEWRSNG